MRLTDLAEFLGGLTLGAGLYLVVGLGPALIALGALVLIAGVALDALTASKDGS